MAFGLRSATAPKGTQEAASAPASAPGVELDGVGMRFGETIAVRDLSFAVAPGEFFSILGPSGCGKTTVLRLIAGFLEPTSGSVAIGGRPMRGMGANQRPTAMIFQNLALFPLMPVWENIAFGLEVRGVPRRERRRRAAALLDLIALPGFADHRVDELSGGQKQRVAIARALAVEPQLLLLDEPLSALDLKLRQHMRAELRALQKRTGVTFLYITHDQGEALAMSDRVAVMNRGRLQQVGSPEEIYGAPATAFVASFVGENNALDGVLEAAENGRATLATSLGRFSARAPRPLAAGEPAVLFVRPERLRVEGAGENRISVSVVGRAFEGAYATLFCRTGDGREIAARISDLGAGSSAGGEADLTFGSEDAVILPADENA